jgi:hypothetical protein
MRAVNNDGHPWPIDAEHFAGIPRKYSPEVENEYQHNLGGMCAQLLPGMHFRGLRL